MTDVQNDMHTHVSTSYIFHVSWV